MNIVPIVMCGGAGTRLWPASRDSRPKHLLPLLEGLSTFQRTLLRFKDEPGFLKPIVIANAEMRFQTAAQAEAAGMATDMILEPSRQDSAAAAAAGALHSAAVHGDDAVCLVLAADHAIHDVQRFLSAVREAAARAAEGLIMTLGVTPTHPATGFGYIAPGEPLPSTPSFRLKAFHEKPDAATARDYISRGYLWNSGNFLFLPSRMIAAFEAHAPDILTAVRGAYAAAQRDADFIRLDAERFAQVRRTSIDYAVMEKTDAAGVTPYGGDWSDIGTFDALWEASPKDADGNSITGDVVLSGVRNSLVQSDERLTAVVGLDDVVVIAERDAVLVASRARSGEVKDISVKLLAANREEARAHNRIHRPWGWYQRIDIGAGFQAKRIHVKPGGKLSLQKHAHRAEHWVVVSGAAEVTRDGATFPLRQGETAYLPLGCIHRMANPHAEPVEIVEVQVGSYTGEDDIVRIEDVYGR